MSSIAFVPLVSAFVGGVVPAPTILSTVALVIIGLVLGYAAVGLIAAVPLLAVFRRRDPALRAGHWSVALLLVPGLVAVWPLALVRVVSGRRGLDGAAGGANRAEGVEHA